MQCALENPKTRTSILLFCVFISAFFAMSCGDESDGGGSCFIECPSDQWIAAHSDSDAGIGQSTICDYMEATNAKECEELAKSEFGNITSCIVFWSKDCDNCSRDCAPEWAFINE